MENWFTIDKIDGDTYAISEYKHPEETHCYLLCGGVRSLLIDTGLGVRDIGRTVSGLTDKPVIAVATHVHWDHIGGHGCFPERYVHAAEREWLEEKFPLPIEAVRKMLGQCNELPEDFDLGTYKIFRGTAELLEDGDKLDLGGRLLTVLHTPGHSPGHMCFWEEERGYLFTGDLVYRGTLFADYPSTDPEAYLSSLEKISSLSVKKIFPGHHTLDIAPEIIPEMAEKFRELKARELLRHGSGAFDFGDWAVRL